MDHLPPLLEISILPGNRGWLSITVDNDDHAVLVKLYAEVESILGARARVIAYDGESPEISVELALDHTRYVGDLEQDAIALLVERWRRTP